MGEQFRDPGTGMGTLPVEQDYLSLGTQPLAKNVLRPVDEVLIVTIDGLVENRSGRWANTVIRSRRSQRRGLAENRLGGRLNAEPDVDAESGQLAGPPVHALSNHSRPGSVAQRRRPPPSRSPDSSRTTSCPRDAATRAASSPPGPPPTTTTFDGLAAPFPMKPPPQILSRKLAGLIVHPAAPRGNDAMHQLHAMQVRLRSSLPSRALRTRSRLGDQGPGGATMSQTPSAMAVSASASDVSRPRTLITGTEPAASRIAMTYGS